MPDNKAILNAINNLNSQKTPNIIKTARKYKIHKTMLKCC